MSATTVSGATTVTNSGVRSLQSVTALPAGRSTGAGINITGSVGDNLRITNTGILTISGGVGITVSTDIASGEVQITNAAPAGNAFAVIQINNDVGNRLIADGVADTFSINSGEGITLTKNTATDTLTITIDPVFDLTGSIFGEDSAKLVDAVENKIVGDIETNRLRTSEDSIYLGTDAGSDSIAGYTVGIGFQAQQTNPAGYTVAVGSYAGSTNQSQSAVAIGSNAGETNQGAAAVAIGNYAGQTSQHNYSLILNASGGVLNSDGTDRFYVAPIRNATGTSGVVQYNSTTKEVSYSSALGSVSGTFTGNIFTSLIDSADSSAITVTPATIFSSDVTVENDLNVTQRFLLRGSRVLNLTDLKSVVAASTDFADFQTRIAALV
jgi:hypothetical protein